MAARRKSQPRARAAVLSLRRARRRRVRARVALPSGTSIAVGLALVAVAGGLYAAARTTSVFAVAEIRVAGATPALARDVRQALAPLAGESLLAVDTAAAARRVEQLPEVVSAHLDRSFPHALVVTVARERPTAVLRRGRESWLVSARARAIRPLARGAHPRLPRVWVPTRVDVAAGARLADAEARRAVRALAALAAEPLPRAVRTVKARQGELTYLLAGGLELRLGDASDLALKLRVAREVLPMLGRSVPYLDVSVPERPVAGATLYSQVEVEG